MNNPNVATIHLVYRASMLVFVVGSHVIFTVDLYCYMH